MRAWGAREHAGRSGHAADPPFLVIKGRSLRVYCHPKPEKLNPKPKPYSHPEIAVFVRVRCPENQEP
jgi:hypothetical protein